MSDQLQDNRKQFFFWDYNGIFELGLTKHALLVRLFLSRCSNNSRSSFPSLNTIASKCDISKKSVQRAILELEEKGLVQIQHRKNNETDAQTSNLYVLVDDVIDVFGGSHTDHGVGSHRPRGVVTQTTEEELSKKTKLSNDICDVSQDIPYSEIIAYLNDKAKKKFRIVDAHKKLIKARWGEGYTLDDFKSVIDKKVNHWLGTEDDTYLQPSTLFGVKFDKYMNQTMDNPFPKQKPQNLTPFVPSAEETQRMLQRVRQGGSNDALQRDSGDGSDWLTS